MVLWESPRQCSSWTLCEGFCWLLLLPVMLLIVARPVKTDNDLECFCSVNFPSRDAATASAPSRAASATALWQFIVYVTRADGKVTETILDIEDPLKAGDIKVVKASLDDDGAVRPYDSTVGVSVTLDWNSGGDYNPEL